MQVRNILLTTGKIVQNYTVASNKTTMVWGDTVAFTITPSPVLAANKTIYWKLIGNTTITSGMVRSGGISGSPTIASGNSLNVTIVSEVVKTSGIQIQLVMADTAANLASGSYKASSPMITMTASPTGSTTLSTPGSGTFTVPANVYKMSAIVDGAGGGGGGNYPFYGSTGGNGGNGGRITVSSFYTTPGTKYTYTIGAGGTGGSSGVDNATAGGSTIMGASTGVGGQPGHISTVRNGVGASGANGGNGLGSPGGGPGTNGTNGRVVFSW